jgi:hypothetical protein
MPDDLALCIAGVEIICSLATVGYALCVAIGIIACFSIQPEQP